MREILIYDPITWLYLFFVLALAFAVLWPGRHDPPARPESGGRDVRLRWGAAPESADADDEPAHDVQQTQQDPRMVEQHGSHASLLRRGGWRPRIRGKG